MLESERKKQFYLCSTEKIALGQLAMKDICGTNLVPFHHSTGEVATPQRLSAFLALITATEHSSCWAAAMGTTTKLFHEPGSWDHGSCKRVNLVHQI